MDIGSVRGAGRVLLSSAVLALVLALAGCGGGGGGASGGTGGGTTGTGGTTGGSTLPDLAITGFSAPSTGAGGSTYTVNVTVANVGSGPAAGFAATILLAPSSNILVDSGMIGMATSLTILNPGQATTIPVTFTLPTQPASGSYYIGANILYGTEVTKANNVSAQAFTLTGGSTCTPDAYEADNSAAAAKPLAFGIPQAHNHCDGSSDWLSFTATAGTTYTLSTSQVGINGWTQIMLYGTDGATLLASGGSGLDFSDSRLTWTAPTSGTYYVRVAPVMGVLSGGAGTDYNVTLGDVRPDLINTALYAPTNGVQGGQFYMSSTVRNQGFADVTGNYDISYYISANPTFDATAVLMGTQTITGPLAIGAYSPYSTAAVTIPAATPLGTNYVFAYVNPTPTANPVSEYATVNNISAGVPITVVSSTCTDDGYEPDNSYTQTTNTITVGAAPQAHNHCLDTTDWVKLNATAGTSYWIKVTPVGGSANPTVQIYDTNGTTLLAPTTGTSNAFSWTAPTTGTYYLLATDVMGAATDYTISVNLLLPDLTEALQPQTTATVTAGDFLNVTDTASNIGYLAAGGFTVGTYMSQSTSVTTASTLMATRSVASLAAQGAGAGTYTNQAWYGAHVAATTPPGTYYVAAIADTGNVVPEISETNNASTPIPITVVAPPCAVDAYEDDDTSATASTIAANTSQSRNNCDDGIDWVKFTPTVSGVYLANTGSFGPNLLVLQSDAVTPVATQDTYFYSQASWNATAGTTYYLQVTNGFPGTGTAYTLALNQCTQDAYEEDDTVAAAKPIVVGATAQAHNHCDDGRDWVSFTAVAGTKYTITGTNVGALANVSVTLYDATGTNIIAFGASAQGGKTNVISWTAPASGTYTIEATETTQWGLSTDYTLQVQ